MSINVDGAASRLLANKTLAGAGYCLYYCWLAISRGLVHYITGGAANAYQTWLAVPSAHRHSSRNVPKDFPAFLGTKLTSRAGDVILSNGTRNSAGELLFVATDWPKAKQVGICTLAQREKQTGRKFVGWASSMGGHELVSTSTAGSGGVVIPEQKRTIIMRCLYNTENGDENTRRASVDATHFYITNASDSTYEQLAWGPAVNVTQAQWDHIRANVASRRAADLLEAGGGLRIVYNTDSTDDAIRRALIGETTFQIVTAAESLREGKLWGATVNVTQGEWDAAAALVAARVAALPAGGTGGVSKADVDAAADRVIGKIPTKLSV